MFDIDFSEEQLPRVVKQLTGKIKPGDILALQGDLAAGKTTLTSALLKHLGYQGRVSSPTFVIEHIYPLPKGKFNEVIHLDFYRLSEEEVKQFDWQEYSNKPKSLVIIEWPERAGSALPKATKFATITRVNDRIRHLRFPADPIS